MAGQCVLFATARPSVGTHAPGRLANPVPVLANDTLLAIAAVPGWQPYASARRLATAAPFERTNGPDPYAFPTLLTAAGTIYVLGLGRHAKGRVQLCDRLLMLARS
jgi:hypothetical protein